MSNADRTASGKRNLHSRNAFSEASYRDCERGGASQHDNCHKGAVFSVDMDKPASAERISTAPAKPVTLVTGASSGIGAALASVFAQNGHEVVLAARRIPQLAAIAESIRAAGHQTPHILPVDLSRPDSADWIARELAARKLEPAFLVNNAGYGLLGQAHSLDRGEQLAMIDLNCRSLTDLSLRFVDSLARHRGGILNVASISGFIPGPGMSVYNATKAYVISFSEGLRRELRPKGIRVTALCPGPVPTEFQARAGILDVHYPRGFDRDPADVARQGYKGLMRGRSIVVPGAHNKLVPLLPRFLPRGFIADMVYRRLRRWDDV